MTESRKIQLETEVDTSGSKQGFERIKADARDMAQSVAQAGQQAGKGLDAIGEGAKRAGDGMTREESRIRSALQRVTLQMQSIGKTTSQQFDLKIDAKGLDASKFAPQLAALRELEQAQAKAAAAAPGQAFIGDLRGQLAALQEQQKLQSMTAEEALRYRAALLGVEGEAGHLITQLTTMRAAQEAVANAARSAAQAEREAATVAASKSSFLSGLQQQVSAIGKTRADLLELRAAELGVAEAAAPMIAKLREADQTQKGFGANGKLNAWQLQQVGFQLHDFGVQVLSGQNALTAFVQQGSQLSGTFGGAGNAFRAVLSLLTPMRIAMIGAAAGVGVLAIGMAKAESAARQLATVQAQLAGTGRQNLFSDNGLRDFIKELSLAPGITRDTATAITSELSKARQIGGEMFKDLARIAVDYAKATGQDVPAATKQLAQAFSDPAKGAKTLDDALGALTSTQQLQIEKLTRLGDIAGAQRILFQALEQSVKGLNDRAATPLQRSLSDLGNAWERLNGQVRDSEGLRSGVAVLAKMVDLVAWLIEHAPKLGGINLGQNSISPGGPLVGLAQAAGDKAREAIFGAPPGKNTSGGKVTDVSQTPAAGPARAAAAPPASDKAADDLIKRQLDVAAAHRSEAGQIKDLTDQRTGLNKALAESNRLYGVNSEQSAKLRDGISGINKQINDLGKGQGISDARLQAKIQAAQDALARERETLAFQDRFLQGQYQAGQVSLVDFYEKKRQAIAAGTNAEIAALEIERKGIEAELATTRDPAKREQDRTRLAKIDQQEDAVRTRGARDTILTNQEQDASFRQLNEQLLNYRANLLQLAGDEAGAARLRNQIIDQQDKILQAQTKGRPGALTDADIANAKAQRDQQVALNEAKQQTSLINQRLQIEEDRIALAQTTGALGAIDALKQEGAAREQAVAKLQEQLSIMERLSQQRPQDLQLKIDVEAFRLQIDKLKAELDPLEEKFRGMFKDAGSGLFSDLMNGTKPRDAIRNFANSLSRQMNDFVGRQLGEQVFGKEGALGGAGGFLADIFGGKDRKKAQAGAIDTSGIDQSLTSLRTSGIDPTTDALARLAAAANGAADTVGSGGQTPTSDAGLTSGDFTRLDRGQTSGEQSVINMFRDASRTTDTVSAANQRAAQSVLSLASASARGGNALSTLPSIINSLLTAGVSGGSGGLGGLIGAFLSGGTGGFQAAFSQTSLGSSGFGSGLAYGNQDLGKFFSSGGYTGSRDPQKVAGVVHGQEYVFSAPAVRAIGLQRLERMHQIAKTGRAANDEIPGYSEGGYVTVEGISRPVSMQSGGQHLIPVEMKAGDQHVTNNHYTYPITVHGAAEMSRATLFQKGRELGRGIDASRMRNRG